MSISPTGNIPEGTDITITVNGTGYADTFMLFAGTEGAGQGLQFTVNDDGCERRRGPNFFTSFDCSVTNADQDTWTATIVRRGNLVQGNYEAKLTDGTGFIATAPFTIGTPPTPKLTVRVEPTSLVREEEQELTISWEPVEANTNFIVDITKIGALPLVACSSSPCSTTTSIPRCSLAAGTSTVTVTQDGQANNSGTATFEVQDTDESDTCNPDEPEPTPRPPFPPCTIGADKDGKLIDLNYQPERANEVVECRVVATAIGHFNTQPEEFVKGLFGFLLSISGGIILLIIIYSGYVLMTSQGNPERVQEARDRITSAVVGFLFIVFSLVILEVIGVDILRIPRFGR